MAYDTDIYDPTDEFDPVIEEYEKLDKSEREEFVEQLDREDTGKVMRHQALKTKADKSRATPRPGPMGTPAEKAGQRADKNMARRQANREDGGE